MLDSLLGQALDKANEIGHEAVDKVFTVLEEPFGQLGEDIGKVAGAVIFNIVLLVASDAIGNLLKEGASLAVKLGKTLLEGAVDFVKGIGTFLGKAWEALRGVGSKLFSREALEGLGKAIEELIEWLKSLMPKLPQERLVPAGGGPLSELDDVSRAGRMESRAVTGRVVGRVSRTSTLQRSIPST